MRVGVDGALCLACRMRWLSALHLAWQWLRVALPCARARVAVRPSLCRLACPRSYDRQHIFMSGSHYIFFEDSSVTDFPLKEVAPEGTPAS